MTGQRMVLAVELGGSHVAAARVDLGAAEIEERRIALDPHGSREELVAGIVSAAAAFPGAERVGVAAPGPFDYAEGIPRMRHKLAALYGIDLRRQLAAAAGVEPAAVRFLNDADAFLLGEWWAGAARGCERAIGITLGTGLGSAFLAGGAIVDHEELYRLPFRGRPVEDAISGRGIAARYGASVDVAALAARARDGDVPARRAFAATGADLAEFVLPHVREFGPDRVVVGGSIARAWDLFGDELAAGLPVEARPAARIAEAPLYGAAWFAGSAT